MQFSDGYDSLCLFLSLKHIHTLRQIFNSKQMLLGKQETRRLQYNRQNNYEKQYTIRSISSTQLNAKWCY
jgi:hypothetical protein